MRTLRVELDPVDTLFFRDARPFGAASRAASGLPTPQTLAGALRTTLIERHDVAPAQVGALVREGTALVEALAAFGPVVGGIADTVVRGPWFSNGEKLLCPVPANLRREKDSDRLVRLDPLASPPPGWQPPARGMLPLWRRGRANLEAVGGYLSMEGLRRFLEGGVPEMADIVPSSAVYAFDDRTGIGVQDESNTTGEGQIYGVRMLSLCRDVVLVAEVTGPAETLKPMIGNVLLMRLGGEGRQARVRVRPDHRIDWPEIASSGDTGRLLLLTTPAWFDGWCPSDLRPVSAAVPDYQAVSGWDLARGGPKPNRFMVPAGAVYFLAPEDMTPTAGLVPPEEAAVGWGNFVEGNWRHA